MPSAHAPVYCSSLSGLLNIFESNICHDGMVLILCCHKGRLESFQWHRVAYHFAPVMSERVLRGVT